jgi:hypothetical protein
MKLNLRPVIAFAAVGSFLLPRAGLTDEFKSRLKLLHCRYPDLINLKWSNQSGKPAIRLGSEDGKRIINYIFDSCEPRELSAKTTFETCLYLNEAQPHGALWVTESESSSCSVMRRIELEPEFCEFDLVSDSIPCH